MVEKGSGVLEVEWHVFRSPKTGKGGPSGPLRDKLKNLGVKIVEHNRTP